MKSKGQLETLTVPILCVELRRLLEAAVSILDRLAEGDETDEYKALAAAVADVKAGMAEVQGQQGRYLVLRCIGG